MQLNHTTNLNLNLPEYADEADIASMNSNMQTIDYAVGDLDDDIAMKVTQPSGGTAGQVLEMGSNGEVKWGEKLPVEDIVSIIEDWLNTYMPPQETVVVDRTLLVQGAAADSKEVGDRLEEIEAKLSVTDDGNGNVTIHF